MECEAVRELYVEALAAGRPAPAEVEGHAERCGACQVELARLEAAWAAVASLPPLEAPAGGVQAIRRRIRWEAAR